MLFRVTIKNLGKLTDAEIRIGNFTVFAGPNNTGKSFVSKALYSLFDAMNANHAEVYMRSLAKPVRYHLNDPQRLAAFAQRRPVVDEESFPQDTMEAIKNMDAVVREFQIYLDKLETLTETVAPDGDEISTLVETFDAIVEILGNVQICYEDLEEKVKNLKNTSEGVDVYDDEEIKDFETSVKSLCSVKNKEPEEIINAGLEIKIRENLIGNFQVHNMSDVVSRGAEYVSFDVSSVGTIKVSKDKIHLQDVNIIGLQQLQKYSRVIYLESPIHWKLRNALESVRLSPRFSRRFRLTGIPEYFYDLARAMRDEYEGKSNVFHLHQDLIDNVIKGKITTSERGELKFTDDKGGEFVLPSVATGVVNLGILAFLIEHNILDKNTFLFIDEPEAHLHPAWQVEMVKTLFALSQNGVNVVIATHSADFLQCLSAFVAEDPDAKKLIALNHFTVDGKINHNGGEFADKLSEIQKELTDPYAHWYYRAL